MKLVKEKIYMKLIILIVVNRSKEEATVNIYMIYLYITIKQYVWSLHSMWSKSVHSYEEV